MTAPDPEIEARTSYKMFDEASPPVTFTLLHATLIAPPTGDTTSFRQTMAAEPYEGMSRV